MSISLQIKQYRYNTTTMPTIVFVSSISVMNKNYSRYVKKNKYGGFFIFFFTKVLKELRAVKSNAFFNPLKFSTHI